MEPKYEDRIRRFISSCILACAALGFVWFFLFLEVDRRAGGYALLAFFAIGGIAIRFEPQIKRRIEAFENFLTIKRQRFRVWRERHRRQ